MLVSNLKDCGDFAAEQQDQRSQLRKKNKNKTKELRLFLLPKLSFTSFKDAPTVT